MNHCALASRFNMADCGNTLQTNSKQFHTSQSVRDIQQLKPLSEKWQGYALAVLAGAFGGTVGLIASPMVLLMTTIVQRNQREKPHQNRFKTWALNGLVGAPLCLIVSYSIPGSVQNVTNDDEDRITGSINALTIDYKHKSNWNLDKSL